MFLQVLFFTLSVILTLLFFLYGFNHYYLLIAARKYRVPTLPDLAADRPAVSIQLPLYNEKYVLRRLMSACADMVEAYGINKASILILDDSDDDTVELVDQVVQEYKEKHFNIDVLRRGNREGFKAGALQAAIEKTEEEFIAIFDADFIPSKDFLLCTLPYFNHNERLSIVQSRWTHHNRDDSIITQAMSHAIDVHFLVEQPGRYVTGNFQNFNGSGGVIRKKAILDAGGWQGDTLAEDLDLSYRMQMLGYHILYLKDCLCPGEIPPTVPNIKQQQTRWANGAMKVARKILPRMLKNRKLGFKLRYQALLHLTGYIIQPLMVISFLLSCLTVLLGVNSSISLRMVPSIPSINTLLSMKGLLVIFLQSLSWVVLFPLIVLCTLAPWLSLLETLKVQNLSLVQNLASLAVLFFLCFGISLSTMQGVGKGLFSNRTWVWTRTPKFTGPQRFQELRVPKYQVQLDSVWMMELAFVVLGMFAIGVAFQHANYFSLVILIPFTISYGFVSLFSILQSKKTNT